MRISDWSSDVCSSDLPRTADDPLRTAAQCFGQGSEARAAASGLRFPGFAQRNEREEKLAHPMMIAARQSITPRASLGYLQGAEHPVVEAEEGAEVAVVGAILAIRSEEHTSELQSL